MSDAQPLARASAQWGELIRELMTAARQQGAGEAEAAIGDNVGLSARVRLGEVETLEHHQSQRLSVTVYFGQQSGSASTTDLTPGAVQSALDAACRIARYTAADPYAGLAAASRLAGPPWPVLDLDHPWALTAEQAIDLAKRCEAAARQDTRITNSEGATVNTRRGQWVYGNTHGFLGTQLGTRHSLSCTVLGGLAGAMERDAWQTIGRAPTALESPERVGQQAAARTFARLGAKRLTTRQVPVVFAPEVARSVLGHLVAAVSGGALYRRASFLLEQQGQVIFPEFVRIDEQPHWPRGLGSAAFDQEGVATRARALVQEGVLQGYVLGSYAARKLGLTTTGNAGGVHNLSVASGTQDQAALLREMDTGVLVSEVMGQGVNIVTGDYSRGMAGFWVEGGEIQYPIAQMTIAGNLRDMFRGLVAVGNDIDRRGNLLTGSWLIERMTVAGT